jgi:hypothetical protein
MRTIPWPWPWLRPSFLPHHNFLLPPHTPQQSPKPGGGGIASEQAWRLRTSSNTEGGLRDVLGIQYVGIEDLFVIVSVGMFGRVPLVLLRRLWLHSKAIKMKARFLARSYHINLSLQLAIRVTMRDEGVRFLLYVGLLAVFCCAYVYYVLEREYAFLLHLAGADGYDPFTSPEYFMNSLWSNVIVCARPLARPLLSPLLSPPFSAHP